MISFKILTAETKNALLDEMELAMPGADIEHAELNFDIMLANSIENVEYAVSYSHYCLLIRDFDGEYRFVYPMPLSPHADTVSAVEDIRAYVIKEEVPLVFSDVPAESLGELLPIFRHANIDAIDEEGRFYNVRVMSEAYLLDEIPTLEGEGNLSLTPLDAADDEIYARLCKDEDTNRYWGYDYSLDESNPVDSYFRECAEAEFNRGVSVCLAVRVNSAFAGEGILYAFDLKGGCECAVRLLPAFRHKGYATESLGMLKELARQMGLVYLGATVKKANKASVHMTGKCFGEMCSDDVIIKYRIKL